jgi:acetyl esterase
MNAYAAEDGHIRSAPLAYDHHGMPPTLIMTAGLDPLRDQGRAYAGALIAAGVPTVYREAVGTIHGFVNLRKAMPSGQADIVGALASLKAMIAEYA